MQLRIKRLLLLLLNNQLRMGYQWHVSCRLDPLLLVVFEMWPGREGLSAPTPAPFQPQPFKQWLCGACNESRVFQISPDRWENPGMQIKCRGPSTAKIVRTQSFLW